MCKVSQGHILLDSKLEILTVNLKIFDSVFSIVMFTCKASQGCLLFDSKLEVLTLNLKTFNIKHVYQF